MSGINHRTRRRGAALVFVAVCLVTLLIVASLAIDVGYICALTAEQQNNADAAALAGASGLRDADATEGLDRVLEILSLNQQPQGFHSLDDQLIEFGWWDSVNQVFHPDPDNTFACRVRAARNDAPLFFAALIGHTSTDVTRQAVAIGTKPCGGIWGLEGVRVAGTVSTDSYDSDDGPYSDSVAGDQGDVCSGRDVRVMGSVEINGDAMAGLGHSVDVNGSPEITGVTWSTLEDVPPPQIDFGDISADNDNHLIGLTDAGRNPISGGNSLRISGTDNLTLPSGEYYFNDLSLGAQGTITFTGPTTLYVTGVISATGGGFINTAQDPGELTIYSLGSEVKLGGDYAFFGTIVAPNAAVDLAGTSEYFGALVGLTVNMHGTVDFHVDESLEWTMPWYQTLQPFLVK